MSNENTKHIKCLAAVGSLPRPHWEAYNSHALYSWLGQGDVSFPKPHPCSQPYVGLSYI